MTSPTQESDRATTQAATYRIRVSGVLGEEWSERSHGMTVSVRRSETENSFTELIGELQDDAAVMGILDALYAHGAQLLSVKRIEADSRPRAHPANDRVMRKEER